MIDKASCILTTEGLQPSGYGRKWVGGRFEFAHRLAYCEHHGIRVGDIAGHVVRHKCDNPPCVNPLHLELGTHADNMRDRDERGRGAKGESHGRAKLCAEEVQAIRERYVPRCRDNGQHALARRYGISQMQVYRILNGDTWTH